MADVSKLAYYLAVYGKGERLIKHYRFAKQFQKYDEYQIRKHQLKEFTNLYKYAYQKIPFYRRLYREAGFSMRDSMSLELIRYLPTVQKSDLIQYQQDFRSELLIPYFQEKKTTGGSTGEPVTLYKSASALARERAVTWVGYEWAGISIADRHARIWGDPINIDQSIKRRVVDFLANRIRLSAFALSDEQFRNYYNKILKFKPVYLYGYVSALHQFSQYLEKYSLLLPKSVKAVIATSEVLTSSVKLEMQNNFKVRVYNEYGCGEVGSIAHECEMGGLHVMESNVLVEIDSNGADGEGEIIITDFANYSMPLIKYRIGDYAAVEPQICECGRHLMKLKNVHGRAYDCLVRANGEKVHPEAIMYIFEMIKAKNGAVIDKFKVIQKSMSHIDVFLVAHKGGLPKRIEDVIKREIARKLPEIKTISFQYVDTIARERSGKMRVVVNELQTTDQELARNNFN